jgi:polyisoprenoid-binding protein YceI
MLNLFRNRTAALVFVAGYMLLALLVLSALPQCAAARVPGNEIVLAIDPAKSKVHWTLDTTLHTVHGTFALKNGEIRLDPSSGKASGEIIVDAVGGKSDNDSRDKKMHKVVLESQKYPEVVFRPDHVDGTIFPQGIFTAQIHGILVLQGKEHKISVPVEAELSGDHWSGSGKLSVPFIDWGLKNPSNFFLKVNHAVEVELELKGNLKTLPAQ